MKLAKTILIVVSYILFITLIILGPEFRQYKNYVLFLEILFFCTGPLLVFMDWKKDRQNEKFKK